MNVWQAIVSALKAEKTEYIFGLPGGELFYDALYDVPKIKTVLVREESAGPFMAMGYARVSGRPGLKGTLSNCSKMLFTSPADYATGKGDVQRGRTCKGDVGSEAT